MACQGRVFDFMSVVHRPQNAQVDVTGPFGPLGVCQRRPDCNCVLYSIDV